jgi:2'-5' RNA ligase
VYRTAIHAACAGTAPFTITLDRVDRFGEQTIYWGPASAVEIDALRNRLVQHVKGTGRVKGSHFKATAVPHVTIASGLSKAQFTTAWDRLKDDVPFHTWRVTEIQLLRRDALVPSSYSVCDRIALRG